MGGSLWVLALLCGCADGPSLPKLNDLNPFAEKAVPLPGKRIPVMQQQNNIVTGELADAFSPIVLPAPVANEDWAQPGGLPNNSPGNLAYSGSGQEAWVADAGSGSGSAGRVTASPVVYASRVYALDAAGNVSAFSTSGGSALWRVSLRPGRENTSMSFLSALSFSSGDSGSASDGGGSTSSSDGHAPEGNASDHSGIGDSSGGAMAGNDGGSDGTSGASGEDDHSSAA